jgi:hypothetical protein
MERLVRTIAIWVCGLAASAIVGGGIGSGISGVVGAIGDTSDAASNAEAWGIVAGLLGFTCARLWATSKPTPSVSRQRHWKACFRGAY